MRLYRRGIPDRSQGNTVLYCGLLLASVGLIITFVGLGERGFRTLELKLIGPSMVGCGVVLALSRIIYLAFIPTAPEKAVDKEEKLFEDILENSIKKVERRNRRNISKKTSSSSLVREEHYNTKKEMFDNYLETKEEQLNAQLDGSTKDLQAFEIFLNSRPLLCTK